MYTRIHVCIYIHTNINILYIHTTYIHIYIHTNTRNITTNVLHRVLKIQYVEEATYKNILKFATKYMVKANNI